MAKKEEKSANWIDSLKETLSSLVIDKLKERARELAEEFVHETQDIIYQTQKNVMDHFSATLMELAGFILIVMAFCYFLMDYFGVQRYWSFLVAGAILIIVSMVVKKKVEKMKYYKFGGE